MSDQRNMLLAIGLSIAVLLAWTYFVPQPERPLPPDPDAVETALETQSAPAGSTLLPGTQAAANLTRADAIGRSDRVLLDAPRIDGSISLTGARLDDVRLKDYEVTPEKGGCLDPEALERERKKGRIGIDGYDPETCEIILLSPMTAQNAFFAEFGWRPIQGSAVTVPRPDTVWTLVEGNELTPTTPITLEYDNGAGLLFRQHISIDDDYMFEVRQSVQNQGSAPVTLEPYGRIARHGLPKLTNIWIVFEGMIGVFDGVENRKKYNEVRDDGQIIERSTGGWAGITDKYWLTAIAPPQDKPFQASYAYSGPDTDIYQTAIQYDPVQIAPGAIIEIKSNLFAGAKKVGVIDQYQESLQIERFDLAVDWGTFWFLTKPLFLGLDLIQGYVGNFGIAILLITVLVKLVFFPLANRSYETMSKMKKLQPQMKEMQELYKDDRVKLQQEMMELYRKEKLNPLAGCLPIFIQIPVFFSLYKVLFVSIEMRHAPFFGWIQDLSARDPTSLFNLFGLLPYDVPGLLVIGAWPVLMGVTMYLQTALNPAPQDPTQKIVFGMMPFVFTIMLASFPAGLVIYWAWNNALSIAQQYVIMKRNGTEVSLTKTMGFDRVAAGVRMLTNRKSDKTG